MDKLTSEDYKTERFRMCLRYIWWTLVLGTTTYIVFGLNQSGWWYLLALLFCSVGTKSEGCNEEENELDN